MSNDPASTVPATDGYVPVTKIRLPKDQTFYELGTALQGDRLMLTYGGDISDLVEVPFDRVPPLSGTTVQISVLSGWRIASDPRLTRSTEDETRYSFSVPYVPLLEVALGGAPVTFQFSFVEASTGRSFDPVIIVDRPPPQE